MAENNEVIHSLVDYESDGDSSTQGEPSFEQLEVHAQVHNEAHSNNKSMTKEPEKSEDLLLYFF